jgi:hypothetical protein
MLKYLPVYLFNNLFCINVHTVLSCIKLYTILPVVLPVILFNTAHAVDGAAGPTSSAQANISITILPRVQTSLSLKTESLSIQPLGSDFDVRVYEDNQQVDNTTIKDKSVIQLQKFIKKYKKSCKKNSNKFLTKKNGYKVLLFMIIANSR